MSDAAAPIAAFDFDGTITPRDTLLPFLYRVAGPVAVSRALVTSLKFAGSDDRRNEMKRVVLDQVFSGRSTEEVELAGVNYANKLDDQVRPAMREQIEWHRSQDHQVVIVSASLHCYLDPLAARLGIEQVIAVGLEDDGHGRLTGGILGGVNTRGPEKLSRLRDWAGGSLGELWAYGDASGDAELLQAATHPMPVTARAHRFLGKPNRS